MSIEANRQKLTSFLANVKQEILNMQSGESKYRNGALHFEKDTCPALSRLKAFEDNPTRAGLKVFLELAKQDFGSTAAEAFSHWAVDVFPPLTTETVKTVVKEFDVLIKDILYDCFKTANIAMTPKQVDLLEKHGVKMARVIKTEISNEVRDQLGALVKGLREKEKQDND